MSARAGAGRRGLRVELRRRHADRRGRRARRCAPGEIARARRRVGQRQDDDRPGAARLRAGRGRASPPAGRASAGRPLALARRARRAPAARAADRPTCRRTPRRRSTRRCASAQADPRRCSTPPTSRERRRGGATRWPRCELPADPSLRAAATRTSSRAASSSAWRSPRRWSASRRSSCWTSRRPASTSSRRRASWRRSRGCARERGLAHGLRHPRPRRGRPDRRPRSP